MKCYKTSKNYKLLKELIDSGKEILLFNGEDAHLASKGRFTYYLGECLLSTEITTSDFVERCRAERIEFIEPTK